MIQDRVWYFFAIIYFGLVWYYLPVRRSAAVMSLCRQDIKVPGTPFRKVNRAFGGTSC